MSSTTTYTVAGMTCGHCVSAVRSEISALTGVTAVDVDLATGSVSIASDEPVEPETVAAAVVEAGYEVVP